MQLRLDLFGPVALQGHDAAAVGALSGREGAHAGLVAALEDPVGQVPQPLLDVGHADFEDELEPGQAHVVAGDRPRPCLQTAGVIGEGQLLEGEGERVAGGEPAGALGAGLGDQLGPHIKEGVAGSAADPLQAPSDECVAIHLGNVERDAAARLVAVDDAKSALGVGGVSDRADVLQVAGRVEEVGRRHQGRPRVDPFGEGLGRDGHAVLRRHELDLKLGPAQPLVADGREVELADEYLVPPGRQR